MSNQGIVYIATGEEFIEEAKLSAQTVRKHMPDVSITLITGRDIESSVFDKVLQIANPRHDFGDQVYSLERTPYERTIFLDTDIYVNGSLTDLFELLDEFDLAAAHNERNYSSQRIEWEKIAQIPDSFPEYNSGVVAFKSNSVVQQFLADWQDAYEAILSKGQIHNQAAFRVALYNSELRIATLPPKYNCIFRRPGTINGQVKVFHGRLLDIETPGAGQNVNVKQAVAEINSQNGLRSYYTVGGQVRLSQPSIIERGIHSVRNRGLVETMKRIPQFFRNNKAADI